MSINNKKLQKEIVNMLKVDQVIRKKQWKEYKTYTKELKQKKTTERQYKQKIKSLSKELFAIDKKHTKRMENIIKQFGWPNKNLVGKQGSRAAWLLIQHADHDVAFQKKCLSLLKEAVNKGEAEKKNLAYLTDRVLVHENKKQIYGTQFQRNKKGIFVPFPIARLQELAKRRKAMDLEPFSVYIKKIEALE